jgi:hypothetical protein
MKPVQHVQLVLRTPNIVDYKYVIISVMMLLLITFFFSPKNKYIFHKYFYVHSNKQCRTFVFIYEHK